jgi:hypothetical protein
MLAGPTLLGCHTPVKDNDETCRFPVQMDLCPVSPECTRRETRHRRTAVGLDGRSVLDGK